MTKLMFRRNPVRNAGLPIQRTAKRDGDYVIQNPALKKVKEGA